MIWLASAQRPYESNIHKNHLACADHYRLGRDEYCFVYAAPCNNCSHLAFGDSVLAPGPVKSLVFIDPVEQQHL